MDGDIFYADGTPLVIEGLDATVSVPWLYTGADSVNITTKSFNLDTYLSMSDDGYADLARKLEKFLAPSEVIVKCSYCGQWAAVKTNCRHCGAAVG